ncbi:30S ribosomal protein S18 [Candidatus Daviesbacteria bacterium RIFCSPLOWO2_02_FULL_36_7]|uniref:Small ribosomal subunit protein bS18 n=1 Tax=Candidatus Daviesbacteria bacterium RIFCSPLOWO2_02_FULL_36_7 TaxID=1797792 RepID=A0A1F5MHH1_9BACT|nr:MAG: 30S ribosomal protein S18 [Candidatus Daviesbacteria bacterium RIFCSPLOWO2_02_FULL_36_7]
MAEKKITRKITKVSKEAKEPVEKPVEAEKVVRKKVCFFCQSKIAPSYTDTSVLRHYLSDRVKIVSKLKSNVCSRHQRAVTKQIKYARHLGLLPFVPKV